MTHSEFTKRLDGQRSCFGLLLEVQNICTAGLKHINITILFKDLCDGIPVVYNEELKPVFKHFIDVQELKISFRQQLSDGLR